MALTVNQRRWLSYLVPLLIIAGMAYLNYASCYWFGYREIYRKHNKAVAISLWAFLAVCQLLVYIYWVVILVVGPGKTPQILPYDLYGTGDYIQYSKPPPYFFCDENGYPKWCSDCRTIKSPRSNHMKALNRCVPKTDHFCIWVGGVIGRDNYRSFFKFMQWYLAYFVGLLGYLASYTPLKDGHLSAHMIIMYVSCGFWIIMILALFLSHLYYIITNITTIDDINIKRAARFKRWQKNPSGRKPAEERLLRFVSVDRGSFRLVVQVSVLDRCYNFGVRNNWINIMLYNNSTYFPDDPRYYSYGKLVESIVVFFIPLLDLAYINTPFGQEYREEVTFCPKFIEHIENKISARRCYLPLYITQAGGTGRQSHEPSEDTVCSTKVSP